MGWTEDDNFKAQMRGRKMHDDWDAYMVESLRKCGEETGQQRLFRKRIKKYLTRQGY